MANTSVTDDGHQLQHDVEYAAFLAAVRENFRAATADNQKLFYAGDRKKLDLFGAFLAQIPEQDRQVHTCSTCHHFFSRFGNLVTIAEDGTHKSAVWPEIDGFYGEAVDAVRKLVNRAQVTGVFVTSEPELGQAKTVQGYYSDKEWSHVAVAVPANLRNTHPLLTAGQVAAALREDYRTLGRALSEFRLTTLDTALTLLRSEALYRSEKCLGAAEWFRNVMEVERSSKSQRVRENLRWRAVAHAPVGFAKPRGTVYGSLLEDIEKDLAFDTVKKNFAFKMAPTQYQRPQKAPSAGNIAQAEVVISKLAVGPAFARRFARLEEVQAIWTPRKPLIRAGNVDKAPGFFDHLQPKEPVSTAPVGSVVTMTFEKFARTILPDAESMKLQAPVRGSYCALLTATDPDAPPILQWDFPDARNPVSWYVYSGGSNAGTWGLQSSKFVDVTAVAYKPHMWGREVQNHGKGVLFLLKGCADSDYETAGLGLFPEILKNEFHGIRRTVEAFSQKALISGHDQASACGITFDAGSAFTPCTIRVAGDGGRSIVDYRLDRWD